MVKVLIKQDETTVMEINMNGHANFDVHGKDLVCAGASSIAVGMMNALDQFACDTCEYTMADGHVCILVKEVTTENQLLLKALICQLKTLEEAYSKFIMIKEQEV